MLNEVFYVYDYKGLEHALWDFFGDKDWRIEDDIPLQQCYLAAKERRKLVETIIYFNQIGYALMLAPIYMDSKNIGVIIRTPKLLRRT